MKPLPVLLAALCLAGAGNACAAAVEVRPVAQDYRYGSHPDIARVLRPADLDFCGIREVEMLYLDSRGQRHLLRYPVWGQRCPDGN